MMSHTNNAVGGGGSSDDESHKWCRSRRKPQRRAALEDDEALKQLIGAGWFALKCVSTGKYLRVHGEEAGDHHDDRQGARRGGR